MIRSKVGGETKSRRSGGSGFCAKEHPPGREAEVGGKPAVTVFVGSAAHRMIGRQLSAAESVAGGDPARNDQGKQDGWARDLFPKPEAYEDACSYD